MTTKRVPREPTVAPINEGERHTQPCIERGCPNPSLMPNSEYCAYHARRAVDPTIYEGGQAPCESPDRCTGAQVNADEAAHARTDGDESVTQTVPPSPDEIAQTLRDMWCPRPCNRRPEMFRATECVDTGECGCSDGNAIMMIRRLASALRRERERADRAETELGALKMANQYAAKHGWPEAFSRVEAERDGAHADFERATALIDEARAERDALRAIYPLLASAWFYGDWQAETTCEREMQAVMESNGWWPWMSELALIDAIDAAKGEKE